MLEFDVRDVCIISGGHFNYWSYLPVAKSTLYKAMDGLSYVSINHFTNFVEVWWYVLLCCGNINFVDFMLYVFCVSEMLWTGYKWIY